MKAGGPSAFLSSSHRQCKAEHVLRKIHHCTFGRKTIFRILPILPVKTRAQIFSSSFSSTPCLFKSFLFPGAYRTGGRLWL